VRAVGAAHDGLRGRRGNARGKLGLRVARMWGVGCFLCARRARSSGVIPAEAGMTWWVDGRSAGAVGIPACAAMTWWVGLRGVTEGLCDGPSPGASRHPLPGGERGWC
jgi:hypothetical protein